METWMWGLRSYPNPDFCPQHDKRQACVLRVDGAQLHQDTAAAGWKQLHEASRSLTEPVALTLPTNPLGSRQKTLHMTVNQTPEPHPTVNSYIHLWIKRMVWWTGMNKFRHVQRDTEAFTTNLHEQTFSSGNASELLPLFHFTYIWNGTFESKAVFKGHQLISIPSFCYSRVCVCVSI